MSQDNFGQIKENIDFLQSNEWRNFQESVGRKTFHIEDEGFWANVIEHQLPIVGKYFYIPRGPIIELDSSTAVGMTNVIDLAKKEDVGWIRIDPADEETLDLVKKAMDYKIVKAPHDMQPKEIFVLDITKSEDELLADMKQKTRYNIKLSQKHKVSVRVISDLDCHPGLDPGSRKLDSGSGAGMTGCIEEFIKLVKITAKRDRITPHPESYYRKMFEIIPSDILKLYVAEYNKEIIAINLMIFCGKTATYLHGASDNNHRNLMAPYLLQWQGVLDAKAASCEKYDLGGIHTKTGEGITKFKLGFAPDTQPVEFPGSWDIIISPVKYNLYKLMQKIKGLLK